jgi:hypothetical protein
MLKLILIFFLLSVSLKVTAQTKTTILDRDTIFLDFKQDSIMNLLLSLNLSFTVNSSNGKLLLTAQLPNTCGIYPAVYLIDSPSYEVQRVNFKNFPDNLFTPSDPFTPKDFIYIEQTNLIVWIRDFGIVLTDTNFNYIGFYISPYIQKSKQYTPVYLGSVFNMDSNLFFPLGIIQRNYKKQKAIFISTPNNPNAVCGVVSLPEIINSNKKRINFSKIINDKNNFPYSADSIDRYSRVYFPDNDHRSFWYTDDFARNVKHYFTFNDSVVSYSLPTTVFMNTSNYHILHKQVYHRYIHSSLIVDREHKDEVVGQIGHFKLQFLPKSNSLVHVTYLITDNLKLISYLDSQNNKINIKNTLNPKERIYQIIDYLTVENNLKIASQLIIPEEDNLQIFDIMPNQISGFKQIFDGEFNRPAIVKWVIDNDINPH